MCCSPAAAWGSRGLEKLQEQKWKARLGSDAALAERDRARAPFPCGGFEVTAAVAFCENSLGGQGNDTCDRTGMCHPCPTALLCQLGHHHCPKRDGKREQSAPRAPPRLPCSVPSQQLNLCPFLPSARAFIPAVGSAGGLCPQEECSEFNSAFLGTGWRDGDPRAGWKIGF